MWEGAVVSIHVAPEASAPMQPITEVRAFPGRGLEGDRYFAGTGYYSMTPSHGGREVTLIEIESVEALFRGVLNAAGERLGITLTAAEKLQEARICNGREDGARAPAMPGARAAGAGVRARLRTKAAFLFITLRRSSIRMCPRRYSLGSVRACAC